MTTEDRKIVYWGVGLSGKSSNLQYIHARTEPDRRSPMLSHATETERLLWFTVLPRSLAPVAGRSIRILLATVPGAVFYDVSRTTILAGAHGVVFVVDSQRARIEANLESLAQLDRELLRQGRDRASTPLVVQYNKRDLPDCASIEELESALETHGAPHVEAVASAGRGVFETLRRCTHLVLDARPFGE